MDLEILIFILVMLGICAIHIVPIIVMIRNAIKNKEIRISRIIVMVCLVRDIIWIWMSKRSGMGIWPFGIDTFLIIIFVLFIAHIVKGVKDKKKQEIVNMHLFDDVEEEEL